MMSDADVAVILPTENVDEFVKLFEPNNAEEGFGVQECEETERYSNSHGLTLCMLNFQPNFELYDMVYSATNREQSLRAICNRLKVKQLIMYNNNPDSEREESVTYDKTKGLVYQGRDIFPAPDSMYLDEDIENDENNTDKAELC